MKEERIKLTKQRKEDMIFEIKKYFLNERGEDMGDLASEMILDFITDKLAPEFYNQGIYDSYRYMSDMCVDLLSIEIR